MFELRKTARPSTSHGQLQRIDNGANGLTSFIFFKTSFDAFAAHLDARGIIVVIAGAEVRSSDGHFSMCVGTNPRLGSLARLLLFLELDHVDSDGSFCACKRRYAAAVWILRAAIISSRTVPP